jgi:hypothetical protein
MKHLMVNLESLYLLTYKLRCHIALLCLMMILLVFDRLARDLGHPLLFKGDLAIEPV